MNIISLDSKPASVDFVRNPICFELSAGNEYLTPGTKGIYSLSKTGTPSDGDSFTLSFLEYTFTFTFKTTIDDSGFQLTAGHSAYDTADQLNYNYYLSKYFIITGINLTDIQFTAKYFGIEYAISFNLTNCPAYSVGGSTPAVDPVRNPNYKVFIQLMVSAMNAAEFEELSTAYLDPDESGKVYYYPGNIIRNSFTTITPMFNEYLISTWLTPLCSYKINYAEYFGQDPVITKLHDHKALTLIDGKYFLDKWLTHDFLSDLAISKIFLTNKPSSQDTWLNAHQYLFFMNYIESDYDFTACFDIEWDDGSVTTKAVTLTYLSSRYENMYCIPCGIAQVGLDQVSPTKTIARYKVYLEHDSTLISEVRYFYLIPTPHDSSQILFKNNYGGLDSLLCHSVNLKYKHDADLLRKFLGKDYELSKGNDTTMIKEQSVILSATTGFLSDKESYQLQEMFENRFAYLVGNSAYVRIQVLGNSFSLIDRKSNLQNFEFDFRISIDGTISIEELL